MRAVGRSVSSLPYDYSCSTADGGKSTRCYILSSPNTVVEVIVEIVVPVVVPGLSSSPIAVQHLTVLRLAQGCTFEQVRRVHQTRRA